MEIREQNYHVAYEPETETISFQGSLRLSGIPEYAPIVSILNEAVAKEPAVLTLNLRQLDFLNSSGITMLSKFVINVRKKNTIKIVIKGSKSIPWQSKSLKNLQRLMPTLTLEIE